MEAWICHRPHSRTRPLVLPQDTVTCALSLAKVVRAEPGWYRGDFHAHTNFSDGSLTLPQLVEVARAEGLDFFAITDHNRIEAFSQFGDTGNLLVIPGMETAREVGGDFNVFGMEGWRDWMGDVCLNKITFLPGDVAWTPNEMLERTATASSTRSTIPCSCPGPGSTAIPTSAMYTAWRSGTTRAGRTTPVTIRGPCPFGPTCSTLDTGP